MEERDKENSQLIVKGCSGAVRYKTNPERSYPSKSGKIIEARRDVYMEKMKGTDS